MMKKYLEKKRTRAPGQRQKRAVQHTDSIVDWQKRIKTLLAAYTR
jgi:hypothetical protein